MSAYWVSPQKEKICVVNADNSITSVYLPIAGDPSSIGDHVDQKLKDLCQSPKPVSEWDETVKALNAIKIEPSQPLTPAEKLAAAGLTVAELKTLLGLPK